MNPDICHCCRLPSYETMTTCTVCLGQVCCEPCSENCPVCERTVCKMDMWECDYCNETICSICLDQEANGWSHPECCWQVTLCQNCYEKHEAVQCTSCGMTSCENAGCYLQFDTFVCGTCCEIKTSF